MAIVISIYTPRLFDRARNIPLSRWRTLALRGPLLRVTIIKAQIPTIKRSHQMLRNSGKDPPYSPFLLYSRFCVVSKVTFCENHFFIISLNFVDIKIYTDYYVNDLLAVVNALASYNIKILTIES